MLRKFIPISSRMRNRMAVVLHPKMKGLRKMNIIERESAYESIDRFVRMDVVPPQSINLQQQFETLSQRRNSLTLEDFLDSDCEQVDSTFSPEFSRYLDEKISHDIEDIREWWFNNRQKYPVLFKLFLRISATPASSAAAERTFSTTGAIITDRRSSLLPSSVGNIILCRNLYRNDKNYYFNVTTIETFEC